MTLSVLVPDRGHSVPGATSKHHCPFLFFLLGSLKPQSDLEPCWATLDLSH